MEKHHQSHSLDICLQRKLGRNLTCCFNILIPYLSSHVYDLGEIMLGLSSTFFHLQVISFPFLKFLFSQSPIHWILHPWELMPKPLLISAGALSGIFGGLFYFSFFFGLPCNSSSQFVVSFRLWHLEQVRLTQTFHFYTPCVSYSHRFILVSVQISSGSRQSASLGYAGINLLALGELLLIFTDKYKKELSTLHLKGLD